MKFRKPIKPCTAGVASKCIGKESATKKFPGLGLKLNSVLLGFQKWCVDQMVCRLNWCLVFATSFSNLILSYQARISILTIPPRNISSSFFFCLDSASLHVKGLKGCVSRVGQIFRIVICTCSMSLVKI